MASTARPLRVIVAGIGTVGGGVLQVLERNASLIAKRTGGRGVEVVGIASRRDRAGVEAAAGVGAGPWAYSPDALGMVAELEADVVVETIGGTGVALDVARAALGKGVSVVTANKAMLALHGEELAPLAEDNGATIGWESAVGGGIPCVKALREGVCAGNEVGYAAGILNGTCNYILTTMKESGRAFDDVLEEAQAKGYAETPPDLDVDGYDTAHKLSLIAAVAAGVRPAFEAVHVEGIRNVDGVDSTNAEQLGMVIKLLGITSTNGDGSVLQVRRSCEAKRVRRAQPGERVKRLAC